MNTRILLNFATVLVFTVSFAQQNSLKYKPVHISADSARSVIRELTDFLADNHPGFYRYNSKPQFDKYIDSIQTSIVDSISEIDLFRKIKPITAKIGCLHTESDISAKYRSYLNQQPNLLPLQIFCKDDHAFIIHNYSSDPTLFVGTEILAINGKPINKLIATLLPFIESDGYNQTMKYQSLLHHFPDWYRSFIEITEQYTITTLQDEKEQAHILQGLRWKEMVRNDFLQDSIFAKPLTFSIENNTGILTIHTFEEEEIKKQKQHFDNFIDAVFDELTTKNIPDLIVDLRDNGGGEDAHAAYFTRHFFDTNFRYWDRIEVTEAWAKSFKNKDNAQLRQPILKDGIWLMQKGKTTKEFDFFEDQLPANNHYNGHVFVLINGACASSCADVSALLSYHKKAVFIGEETGGGFQGNTSGMVPTATVKTGTFTIALPYQKYFNSVNPSLNIGHGTFPDHPVSLTTEDLLNNHDKAMEYVWKLVKKD